MAKILIISSVDSNHGGQGKGLVEEFEKEGHEVTFLAFRKRNDDTKFYIIDETRKYSIRRFIHYHIIVPFRHKFGEYKKIDSDPYVYLDHRPYVFYFEVARKISFKPDYIFLSLNYNFLSPKQIQKLYNKTGATMIFSMVDDEILTGGCHNTFECLGFTNHCHNCPALIKNKHFAEKIYNEKAKYLTNLKAHLLGTTYCINKAIKSPIFQNKTMHVCVGTPNIPFLETKEQARQCFQINPKDFVIFVGAQSLDEPRKGMDLFIKSVIFFVHNIDFKRNVTILLLGKTKDNVFHFDSRINVVAPGFMSYDNVFRAYYACDVFVSPTIADAGPFMVNYSIACGRPVLAFPIGIALDLVHNGETGYISPYKDAINMGKRMVDFYNMSDKQLSYMNKKCIELMEYYRSKPKWYKDYIK